MQDGDGRWKEEPEDVEKIILDYFSSIFSTDHPVDFEASLSAVNRWVSDEMNDFLLREFKEAKVWSALKQMHPTKSPGPDGMSTIFFQKYWEVVGSSVINCVIKTLKTGIMPSGLNDTYICLIPKVKCPQEIIKFRPISLCNVVYKIVSKVLANRLKSILLEVINESQSAFVPGRQITDNVLVAFETMHCIDWRRKGKRG